MRKEVTSISLKYVFSDNSSGTEKETNPIPAQEIVDAIKCGKNIEIINAVIEGPFTLKHINIDGKITIKRTKIRGQVDWSYAVFKQVLNLENSTFETDATFTGIMVEKDIFQDNVTFVGNATFSDITVNGVFYSRDSTFKKGVTFVESIFNKRVEFSKSTFECKAIFNQTQIVGSAFFDTSIFKDEADFGSAQIGGIAQFSGAKFKKLVNFNGAKIDGAVFFNKAYLFRWDNIPGSDDVKLIQLIKHDFDIDWSETNTIEKIDDDRTIIISAEKNTISLSLNDKKTKVNLKIDDGRTDELFAMLKNGDLNICKKTIFEDEADFGITRIYSAADFSETVFRKNVNFSNAIIEGSAFFDAAIFKKNAIFIAARFDDNAIFNDAKFCQEAKFSVAKIMGYIKFNSVIFKGNVDFSGVIVGSAAEFNNAEFKQNATFNSAKIEGAAFFRSAIFRGDFDFSGVQNGLAAEFQNAAFIQIANFSNFHIKKYLKFESTIFNDKVKIEHAHIEAISLKGAYFGNDVSFKYTSFGTFYFEKLKITPNVKINFRGCTYNDIDPIDDWEELMEYLDPYDRQPFAQLEETFRRAGKINFADDVYYKGRCREFTENNITIQMPFAWINRFLRWLKDLKSPQISTVIIFINGCFWFLKEIFLRLLTGYGVRVRYLMIYIVFILVAGTLIFNQPGAVVLKSDANQTLLIWPMDSYWEAFYVSLNLFLPIEIPSGAFWKPSQNFAIFGTLLKLAGWILVPIGVAGISGLLKRSK